MILILGGTGEGRRLAARLPGEVVSSLAGRVTDPRLPEGEVRIGGFGGVDGLVEWLRANGITGVVDATHPFAATMTAHAVEATARAGVPLLVLRRSGWTAGPGDDWRWVDSLEEAAADLPGDRVFLTTGRQDVGVFAGCGANTYLFNNLLSDKKLLEQVGWFLLRHTSNDKLILTK